MALPLAYRTTRVSILGTFGGGVEEWSTGFWFGNANGDADLPDQALADGIRDAWRTFFTANNSWISPNFGTTTVKLASHGTDGRSDANDTIYSEFNPVANGTIGSTFPPQVSLAVTMTGPQARGLASKGRMYLPGVGAGIGGNGKVNGGALETIAQGLQTFFNAVNALPANNVILLASHGQLTKNLDGEWIPKVGGYGPVSKPVQGLKLGDVYDTQRRRRNGLTETYVQKALI